MPIAWLIWTIRTSHSTTHQKSLLSTKRVGGAQASHRHDYNVLPHLEFVHGQEHDECMACSSATVVGFLKVVRSLAVENKISDVAKVNNHLMR